MVYVKTVDNSVENVEKCVIRRFTKSTYLWIKNYKERRRKLLIYKVLWEKDVKHFSQQNAKIVEYSPAKVPFIALSLYKASHTQKKPRLFSAGASLLHYQVWGIVWFFIMLCVSVSILLTSVISE